MDAHPSALELIEAKRDGGEHTARDLQWLVRGVVDGSIPDYQLAAWLMAVVWRGMTWTETVALTEAMAGSGDVLDLAGLPGPTVDKHSTGGVGDKTSLVVGPLAAATGLTVAKMTGAGLGHTGGTVDKLESIPGLSTALSPVAFLRQAAEIGLVMASQTADLAPADKRLYALRDVTGTVPSLPLIAASIMSKKLAAGADGIVLDVKVGRGAFISDLAPARELAELMIGLGAHAGRRMAAVLTEMDQPLGRAIGNALEVAESAATLRGDGPSDLTELCLTVAGLLHVVAGRAHDPDEVRPELLEAIRSGAALDRLAAMVRAQGGDDRVLADTDRLPSAPIVRAVRAPRDGVVTHVDALAIGRAAVELGAGRRRKGDAVDPAVGIVLARKAGDGVRSGEPLAMLHARDEAGADRVAERVAAVFRIGDAALDPPPLIHAVIQP